MDIPSFQVLKPDFAVCPCCWSHSMRTRVSVITSTLVHAPVWQLSQGIRWSTKGSTGLNHFFPNFFPKNFFPKSLEKFGKSLWKKFGKSLETGANSKGTCFFGHHIYVRRFSSFVSARTFADMTTWPYMTMTTLKKSKTDPIFCWACTLQPSAGPGPPAPAVANTTWHANGQRPSRRINHRRCYGSGDEQAIQWASRFQ